jgi:hypothetical protein
MSFSQISWTWNMGDLKKIKSTKIVILVELSEGKLFKIISPK